jgi:LysM repeat protein
MAIVVPVISEWSPKGLNDAVADLNKAKGALGGLDKSGRAASNQFNNLGSSIKKLGLVIGATFGAREIGRFFSSSIKGAIALESAQNRLRKILITTGGATNLQVDSLLKQADALEKLGVVSKENIMVAQSQLATFDLTSNTIKQLTPAILDYVTAEKGATASAEDFKSMTNGLAQALQGNFASLTKTGFVLDEATKKQIKTGTESERVTAIIKVLDSTYKGFNKSLLDTPEGQIIKLKQGFGDLKEEVGFGFLRAFQLVTDAFKRVGVGSDTTTKSLGNMGKEVGLIIEGLGGLTAELITTANATQRTFKGLAATIVTEIASSVLTLPKWVINFLQGKAPSVQFPSATATPAGSRIARLERENQKALEMTRSSMDQLSSSTEKASKKLKAAEDAAKKLKDEAIKAAEAIVSKLKKSLDEATSSLDNVKNKFDDFKNAISGTITGIIDFGKAAETENFLQGLVDQANNAKVFADKVKKLVQLGLSERAIRLVLDAGFEAGSLIADQIIAGGSSIVNQVNELVSSVATLAEQVGEAGAEVFYGQGVRQAQALVNGIQAELDQAIINLDKIKVSGAPGGTGTGTTTAGAAPTSSTYVVKPGDSLSAIARRNNTTLQDILNANPKFSEQSKYKGGSTIFSGTTVKIPKKAMGGLVSGRMPVIVGENGPELFTPNVNGAITPNNESRNLSGTVFNITVNAGIGTSGAQVGQEIVDAIKRFEKTSGPVFASA